MLDRWLAGGESAVREYVFGIQGVTPASVRDAASGLDRALDNELIRLAEDEKLVGMARIETEAEELEGGEED